MMNDATIIDYFEYAHLPEGPLKQTSMLICVMAHELAKSLPEGIERDECLRKLLEAKDCAVRAHVYTKR